MLIFIGNISSQYGLNPAASEDLINSLSSRYKIIYASGKRNLFLRLFDMALTVFLNRKKCQLLIIDIFGTMAFIFAILIILLAKFYKIPYIPILRGGYIGERYKRNPLIFNFLFSTAYKVISPSYFLKQYFDSTKFPIDVIPDYINLSEYTFKKRVSIRPRLLWVRSIHSLYNPLMAIDVLAKVKEEHADVHLCMVGPIKDNIIRDVKSKIDELNLINNITFTGKLSKNEWKKISSDYDIFINTTNYDNTPVTILEAMALGLPIVSTDVGGIPFLLDHQETGLLVKPNDAESMTKYIICLISAEINYKKIINKAYEHVSKFDKNIVINQWIQLFDNLIEN